MSSPVRVVVERLTAPGDRVLCAAPQIQDLRGEEREMLMLMFTYTPGFHVVSVSRCHNIANHITLPSHYPRTIPIIIIITTITTASMITVTTGMIVPRVTVTTSMLPPV